MEENDAITIFRAGVRAVQPETLIPRHIRSDPDTIEIAGNILPRTSFKNLFVIAIGKAAPAMAKSVCEQLTDIPFTGLCITKHGHGLPLDNFQMMEAGHPVPDEASQLAARHLTALLDNVREEDMILLLLSGGASSLLADIPEELDLASVRHLTEAMVRSGAAIHEINTVRKHLATLKGGRLARRVFPARLFTLVISDVNGDDLSAIASGPTVPDPSTFRDTLLILKKYGLWEQTPVLLRDYLQRGADGLIPETPKPGEKYFVTGATKIIGNNRIALEAAAVMARALGYHVIISEEALSGDTAEAAVALVQFLSSYDRSKPLCYLAGGETTIRVEGKGLGGRNQHFVLKALDEIGQRFRKKTGRPMLILSGGTDGTDGPTDAAGAWIQTSMLETQPEIDTILRKYLNEFDAYHFFKKTGSLIKTGPTQTNVMDLVIALIPV